MEQQIFDDVFGTAQVGGGEYLKAEKIAKGVTIARLIPPIKSLKVSGKWSHYHAVHYGYYGSNKKDPNGKPWAKPFLCIEEKDMRTKMVTRECPKCEQVKAQEGLLKEREGEIRKDLKGRSEDAIKSALKADPAYQTLAKWLKQHNVDRHQYINMKLATGDVKCIKIPSKCMTALRAEIDKLRAKKIDPFAANAGVYFAFDRQGENTNTVYSVAPAKEEFTGPDGSVYERTKTAPLSVADVEAIKARAMDLPTAHGATVLTEEQIRSLVQCDEDPATVDAIFEQAQPAEQQHAATSKATPVPAPTPTPTKPAPKPDPTPVQEQPSEAPAEEDDEEAAAVKALAEARAKKAAKAAAAAAAKAVAKPAPSKATAIDDMDPDQFIAEFGDPSK